VALQTSSHHSWCGDAERCRQFDQDNTLEASGHSRAVVGGEFASVPKTTANRIAFRRFHGVRGDRRKIIAAVQAFDSKREFVSCSVYATAHGTADRCAAEVVRDATWTARRDRRWLPRVVEPLDRMRALRTAAAFRFQPEEDVRADVGGRV